MAFASGQPKQNCMPKMSGKRVTVGVEATQIKWSHERNFELARNFNSINA